MKEKKRKKYQEEGKWNKKKSKEGKERAQK